MAAVPDESHIHPALRTHKAAEPVAETPCTPWPTTSHFQPLPTPTSTKSGQQRMSPQTKARRSSSSQTRRKNSGSSTANTTFNSTPTTPSTDYTRQSYATTNTARSSAPTTVGSMISTGSDMLNFALDGRLYQLGQMDDGQIMDMRCTAALLVRPVRPATVCSLIRFLEPIVQTTQEGSVRTRNLQQLRSLDKALLELMVNQDGGTKKKKWASPKEKRASFEMSVHNVRLQLSDVVHSIGLSSLFGPVIGAEWEQTELMVLLMLHTRSPPPPVAKHRSGSGSDTEREKTKYSRLANRIGRARAKFPKSDFLDQWDYRLRLIGYAETLYWDHKCDPVSGLIRTESAVLPHHALSLMISQLALWPNSERTLGRTRLSQPQLKNAIFLHLHRHDLKFDFEENFKDQIGRIRKAWLGHDDPLAEQLQDRAMGSIMSFGSTCESEALERWSVKPRSSNMASPGTNSDKPLPSPNAGSTRKESVGGSDHISVLSSDKSSTNTSMSSPTRENVHLPDLEQRQQRIRDKLQGKPTSWDPPAPVPQITRSISLKDPSPFPDPSTAAAGLPKLQRSVTTSMATSTARTRPSSQRSSPNAQQQKPAPEENRFLSFFRIKSRSNPTSSSAGQACRKAGRATIPTISGPTPAAGTYNVNAHTAFVPPDENSIKMMSADRRHRAATALAKKSKSNIRSPPQVKRDRQMQEIRAKAVGTKTRAPPRSSSPSPTTTNPHRSRRARSSKGRVRESSRTRPREGSSSSNSGSKGSSFLSRLLWR